MFILLFELLSIIDPGHTSCQILKFLSHFSLLVNTRSFTYSVTSRMLDPNFIDLSLEVTIFSQEKDCCTNYMTGLGVTMFPSDCLTSHTMTLGSACRRYQGTLFWEKLKFMMVMMDICQL